MSNQIADEIFRKSGAIITGGHFVYAKKSDGWHHGSDYVNKDAIYLNPDHVSQLCLEFVKFFQNHRIDVVVGPTTGGISLSQQTTKWLKKVKGKKHVVSVFADEVDVIEEQAILHVAPGTDEIKFTAQGNVKIKINIFDGRISVTHYDKKIGTRRLLKRGYDQIVKDKNCLIVEDIINSGATVMKTRDEIIRVGGRVVGVGALCNRSGGTVTAQSLNVPDLFSLIDIAMPMYPEDDCPLCKHMGIMSVDANLGKGPEFLSRMAAK